MKKRFWSFVTERLSGGHKGISYNYQVRKITRIGVTPDIATVMHDGAQVKEFPRTEATWELIAQAPAMEFVLDLVRRGRARIFRNAEGSTVVVVTLGPSGQQDEVITFPRDSRGRDPSWTTIALSLLTECPLLDRLDD